MEHNFNLICISWLKTEKCQSISSDNNQVQGYDRQKFKCVWIHWNFNLIWWAGKVHNHYKSHWAAWTMHIYLQIKTVADAEYSNLL